MTAAMVRARGLVLLAVLGLLTSGLTAGVAPPAAAATVPAGFSDTHVASMPAPTAMAFTSDGRMLVTEQAGRLRLRTAVGTLLAAPALDLRSRVCPSGERGLLGVATDPDPATRAIYLFYTGRGAAGCPASQSGNPAGAPANRVSRFVLRDDDTVDPASERVPLDGIATPAGNHNAGDLHVGKDGYLYVSTGDGGCDYAGDSGCAGVNDATRDRNVLLGKILRVDRTTGAPAPDNPFLGAGTASCRLAPAAPGTVCRETFAWGLRNPFRFAFDPDAAGTAFHINDVGQNAWEEIDRGVRGAEYGWNLREGHCAQTGSATDCGPARPAGMTDPIHDYGRGAGCGSITGGAFVPNGVWPAAYDAGYLFADYVCGRIMMLDGGVRTRSGDRPRQPGPPGVRPARRRPGALLHDLRRRRGDPADRVHRDGEPHADRGGRRDAVVGGGPTDRAAGRHPQQRPRRRRADLPVDVRRRHRGRHDHGGERVPHLPCGQLDGDAAGA